MVYVEYGGGCSPPVKVRNMEKAGAQAVLIAGAFNKEEEWFGDSWTTTETRSEDAAMAYNVKIPAFLIERAHSDKLQKSI